MVKTNPIRLAQTSIYGNEEGVSIVSINRLQGGFQVQAWRGCSEYHIHELKAKGTQFIAYQRSQTISVARSVPMQGKPNRAGRVTQILQQLNGSIRHTAHTIGVCEVLGKYNIVALTEFLHILPPPLPNQA